MKKKNGFTLVEVLAVITILAIILVIAVPKILDTLKTTRENTFIANAKIIAKQAEDKLEEFIISGKGNTVECSDIGNLNTETYKDCTIKFDKDGNAKVNIKGQGKYEGMNICGATINGATLTDLERCYTDESCFAYEIKKNKYIINEEVCVPIFTTFFESSSLATTFCAGGTIEGLTLEDAIHAGYFDEASLIQEGIISINENDGPTEIRITGYDLDCEKDVLIPYKIDGATVVEIGDYAFTTQGVQPILNESNNNYNVKPLINNKNNPKLTPVVAAPSIGIGITSIKLPSTIKSIGECAFQENSISGTLDLSNLSSLSEIGESSFHDNEITYIKLPASTKVIGASAFSSNSLLNTLDLSNLTNLIAIGDHAFQGNQITTLKLPNSIEHIGWYAFYNNSLSNMLDLSGLVNLAEINTYTFGDNSITSVKLPKNLTSIGTDAFLGNSISGELNLSELTKLATIGDMAFAYMNITSITLPASVTNIGDRAFSPHGTLSNVTLGNTNATIGTCAFGGIASITTHNIPSTYSCK